MKCVCVSKDVGIGKSTMVSLLSGARGVREVSAAGNGNGIGEVDGSLVPRLPVVLRPAPGISFRLSIPQVVKVLLGAPVLRKPGIKPYKIQTNVHQQQSEEGTRPLEDFPFSRFHALNLEVVLRLTLPAIDGPTEKPSGIDWY